MSYPHDTIAPHTYQDAHEGTTQIRRERIRLRDEAEKYMMLRSDFEDYQDRPYLEESGRHRLYQVALDPGEVGKRFAPADVVLVHPDDLQAQP